MAAQDNHPRWLLISVPRRYDRGVKLLIITQEMDTKSPTLGFFHRWVEEFAKHCEMVTVICLKEGKHNLPSNVKVLSLGKEKGVSRLMYLLRFYTFIWAERKNYDSVLVHMNQEYIILGALPWHVLGKKVTLWRNHYAGSWVTRVAGMLSDRVFYTSSSSYTASFKNATQMPVGAMVAPVSVNVVRIPRSILFLGRIAPPKKPELFIDVLGILKDRGVDFTASLYGPAESDAYLQRLKAYVAEKGLLSQVTFGGALAHDQVGAVYAAHDIYVNLAQAGMYDKTSFEAALCGATVVTANTETPFIHTDASAEACAGTLVSLLEAGAQPQHDIANHTLEVLVGRMMGELEKSK